MTGRKGAAHQIDGGRDRVGSDSTVPAGSDTIPAPRRDPHRIGCLLGCRGYGHDDDCPLGEPMVAGTVCSLDRRCSAVGIEVLTNGSYPVCPCVEAQAAHGGVA